MGQKSWRSPRRFRLLNMVKMQLQYYLFIYLSVLLSSTGRTDRLIRHIMDQTTRVLPKKVPLRSYRQPISLLGLFLPPKIPKFPIVLAGSRKTHEPLRAYLHEGSTDDRFISNDAASDRVNYFSHKIWGKCAEGFKLSKHIPLGESQPNEPTPSLG